MSSHKERKARQILEWSYMLDQKKPAAAALSHHDFLQGLPLRAGMASEKAHGRSLPCGSSDGLSTSICSVRKWKSDAFEAMHGSGRS